MALSSDEVRIVFFGYMLSLFSQNFKPRLVMPKFQASVSVYRAAKLPPLQPAPRLVIPKFGRARELPPHPKSLPQPRHMKSPFYPSAGNEAPHRGVKTGGGTLVTYPTFRTSASPSHGSPYLPLRTPRPPKPAKPHAPPSASRPPPSRRLFSDYVVHRNSSPSLIHRTG